MRKIFILNILIYATLSTGCDQRSRDDLETTLKDDRSRPGKVGSLRGLEVHDRARKAAQTLSKGYDARCAPLDVDTPLHVEVDLKTTLMVGSKIDKQWHENRTIIRDKDKNVEVVSTAEFSDGEISGTRSEHFILFENTFIHGRSTLGASSYYRKQLTGFDLFSLAAKEPLASLLATTGWDKFEQKGEDALSWELGSEPLNCGGSATTADIGTVVESEFSVSSTTRKLMLKTSISTARRLTVEYTETVKSTSKSVAVPDDITVEDLDVEMDQNAPLVLLKSLRQRGIVTENE